ncbi:Zn-dependent hydrolase [Nguyenibacter vanlangensis]|uniref:Zn-dependent hydrolase n=1 Tax=Nguyenibacter vanlangensis TaxID=1216886 RepID=A0ABZ3DA96_9PROT
MEQTIHHPAGDGAHALDRKVAEYLFSALHDIGFDGQGITRATYGAGENAAHLLIETTARGMGLEIRHDWAANLYVTLPGRDRSLPAVMTGSHMDSVPGGGNYDGAAGVVAGLTVLAAWKTAGFIPDRDVTVMAIRAEESAWFPISYLGSKAAFGLLGESDLETPRNDGAGTLADMIRLAGGRPDDLAQPALHPAAIDSFIELHIEQGPVLLERDYPVGIVSGICGSIRYRSAAIHGQYAHSGATPRNYRADTVIAGAAFMLAIQREWIRREDAGQEMTLTFGVCRTEADLAHFSAVAGRLDFSIDVRSRDTRLLREVDDFIHAQARAIGQAHHVRIALGQQTSTTPSVSDDALVQRAMDSATGMGIPAIGMPSGAGHDTALFATQGIPTLMIFVRNEHGSHNPMESMELSDFMQGCAVLEAVLRGRATTS